MADTERDKGTAEEAIEFALDECRQVDALLFLAFWRDDELDGWPEFYAWLHERGR